MNQIKFYQNFNHFGENKILIKFYKQLELCNELNIKYNY